MNILILCYAISPYKGSEFAFGWDYIKHISKNHNIYLIYGVSEDKLGETDLLEHYLKKHPIANLKIYPVKSNFIIDIFEKLNHFGLIWFWHLGFRFWQKKVLKTSKRIIESNKIDIIHTLNPQGFREPGYLWSLPYPHLWGPVGGANFIKKELIKNLPVRHKIQFKIRNLINSLQLKYSSRIRKSVEASQKIIFSTTANLNSFQKVFDLDGPVISEMGFPMSRFVRKKDSFNKSSVLRLVWAGSISTRKNLSFLFEALAKSKLQRRIELNIIGSGNIKEINNLKELYETKKSSFNLVWHGKKTRDETINLLTKFDLHVIVSLSEASTSVLYEALSVCLPTISLNQDGMSDTLKDGLGFLVPITSYEETVLEFSNKIDEIILDDSLIRKTASNIEKQIEKFTWEHKIKYFEKIYSDIHKQ